MKLRVPDARPVAGVTVGTVLTVRRAWPWTSPDGERHVHAWTSEMTVTAVRETGCSATTTAVLAESGRPDFPGHCRPETVSTEWAWCGLRAAVERGDVEVAA